MGAWGIGTYQNDSALDFAIDVLETSFEEVYNVERALVWVDMVILFGEVNSRALRGYSIWRGYQTLSI